MTPDDSDARRRRAADDPQRQAPTFSVVVPAYNAERTIGATLRSILGQTRTDFEIIAVDDGSSDGTAARVGELDDARIQLVRKQNAGVAEARNTGIALARGTFVSFLDADDVWLPGYLESMAVAFERQPDAGLAFTDAWVWDEAVHRFARRTIMSTGRPPDVVPDDPRQVCRRLLEANFVFTSATVRREMLDDVGGFQKIVSPSEDWELWLRIAAKGYRVVRAAPVLAVYRNRAGSLSSSREVMKAAERRVLEQLATYIHDEELSRVVEARLQSLARAEGTRVGDGDAVQGRERITRYLPASLRLRSYRLRVPWGVPASVVRLLQEPYGSS